MKLSDLPATVKRLMLATCDAEWDMDELDALETEELRFLRYYHVGAPGVFARIELGGRPGVGRYEVDAPNPWGDEAIEQDEPLPALSRDSRFNAPELLGCIGWAEATLRLNHDGRPPREEWTRARYEDTFEREATFGWPLPAFKTWAKRQRYEG